MAFPSPGQWSIWGNEAEGFVMGKKLVVIGGGAGGPSAAAKAKRLDPDLEVTILEAGEHVSFAT